MGIKTNTMSGNAQGKNGQWEGLLDSLLNNLVMVTLTWSNVPSNMLLPALARDLSCLT